MWTEERKSMLTRFAQEPSGLDQDREDAIQQDECAL
jgi:hypothetical protein